MNVETLSSCLIAYYQTNASYVIFTVLVVCYFWDDFKIHASDVYHRYVTNDISLAVEIIENDAEQGGTAEMKLAEMEKKVEEFMATERSARMQLAKRLDDKTETLGGKIKKRKLAHEEIAEKLEEATDGIFHLEECLRGDRHPNDIRWQQLLEEAAVKVIVFLDMKTVPEANGRRHSYYLPFINWKEDVDIDRKLFDGALHYITTTGAYDGIELVVSRGKSYIVGRCHIDPCYGHL